MAPKNPLITTGTKPAPGKAPRHPLTTRDKIAAAHAKANPKNTPRMPPGHSDSRRPRSLAPPSEISLLLDRAATAAGRKGKAPRSWDWTKNKAITTHQKLTKARMMRNTKFAAGAGVSAESLQREEVPSTMNVLAAQTMSIDVGLGTAAKRARVGESVLVRATERAKRWRRLHPESVVAGDAEKTVFVPDRNLLDLPTEVLNKIWALVVVDTRCIVWPDSPSGREQPDLAMTCKQIRAQVLEIYYSSNIFGIIISPPAQRPAGVVPSQGFGQAPKSGAALTGMAAVQKWGKTLSEESIESSESGKWFTRIRNWAFDFTDPHASLTGKHLDGSFLVTLHFNEPAADEDVPEQERERPATSLPLTTEVHREATCILPGWKEFGACQPKTTPFAMNYAVMKMLEAGTERGGGGCRTIKVEQLLDLATNLRGMAEELRGARCVRGHSG